MNHIVAFTLIGTAAAQCDCSWTQGGANCGNDDGSSCFKVCCGGGGGGGGGGGPWKACSHGACCNPYSSTPQFCPGHVACQQCGGDSCQCPDSPGPSPGPSPPSGQGTLYCLSRDDLVVAYGSGVTLMDGGYTIRGGSGVATKSAFNLLGGYAEFTYDVSRTNTGVNTNIYTISPSIQSTGFVKDRDYCDGADNPSPWCMEDDWVESNGNCGGATTLHTVPGPGMFCGSWGCRQEYHYNGQTKQDWRVEYSQDGQMTVKHGSETVGPNSLNPGAQGSDWGVVKNTMNSKGVVLYSSQWGNWVPVDSCGPAAHDPSSTVDNSMFTISGLKIFGTVVQGPEPRKCSDLMLNATIVV